MRRELSGSFLALLTLILCAACFVPGTAFAQDAEESAEAGEGAEDGSEGSADADASLSSLRRSNRMEFDARLIRGETAGSGAVFLFQRAPRALPSMVKTRSSYLQGTIDDVLGDGWAEERSREIAAQKSRKRGAKARKKADVKKSNEATKPSSKKKKGKKRGKSKRP